MSTRLFHWMRISPLDVIGLVVLLVIGNSSAGVAAAESPAVKSWRIEGRVVDEHGAPVSGARVFTNELSYLPSEKKSSTKSGNDGRFQLDVAHSVNGRMIRASYEKGKRQAGQRLPYEADKAARIKPLELVLRPAREIDSVVMDTDQKPVGNATVLVTAGYEQVSQATTDSDGHASVHVPADLPLRYIVAMKPGVGLDYWTFRLPDEPKSDPYKLAPGHAAPLYFVLNGVRVVTVRVVNDRDKPLVGVEVYPWLLEKPNKGRQGEDLNLSGLSSVARKRTTMVWRRSISYRLITKSASTFGCGPKAIIHRTATYSTPRQRIRRWWRNLYR